jgi:uncharacterized protein (TIGR02679 family)
VSVPPSLALADLAPVWAIVRERLERCGFEHRGRIRLPPLGREAALVMSSLQRRRSSMLDLAQLEAELRRLGVGDDLVTALAMLGHEPSTEPAQRRAERAALRAGREAARGAVGQWEATWAAQWIDEVIRAGLLRRLREDDAVRLVARAQEVLDFLEARRESELSRVDVAAQSLGDAHALDDGTRLEAMVRRALRNTIGDERRDVWAAAGVHRDLVSVPVLTWNLPLTDTPLAAAATTAVELGVPMHITELALRRHPIRVAEGASVLVVENPRVAEAAAQRCPDFGLVCTSGNPSLTTRSLLRRLTNAGATLRYHGDFDAAGLAMAARMLALGIRPWRMTADDYEAALVDAERDGVDLPIDDAPVPSTLWHPALQRAFEKSRRVVHEERLLDQLLSFTPS